MSIQYITGSLEGTKLTGSFGRITSLTDSDITITSSVLGSARFTLPKGLYFTDTGAPSLVLNSITEAIIWGEGQVIIEGGLSGSITPIPPIPVAGGIFISGSQLSRTALEALLTGETYVGWETGSVYTQYTSSTNYTVNNSAFLGNTTVKSFIDNGFCTNIGDSSFRQMTNLTDVYFPSASSVPFAAFFQSRKLENFYMPNVTSIGASGLDGCDKLQVAFLPKVTSLGSSAFNACISASFVSQTTPGAIYIPLVTTMDNGATFQNCTKLTSAILPNVTSVRPNNTFANCVSLTLIDLSGLSRTVLTSLGGTVGASGIFNSVPNIGTITVPIQYATNNGGNPDGDLQYLITLPRNWTINYV